jgi:hypothetical protein
VRSNPRHFALLHGHEHPDAELVVEEHPGYVIVEKHHDAGLVAEAMDPRS